MVSESCIASTRLQYTWIPRGGAGCLGAAMPAPFPLSASDPIPLNPDQLESFRLGHPEAFAAVFQAYASRVRSMVARFMSSPVEQEEAVQEAWLLIHRMRQSYSPERGSLPAWLCTLTANRCKELLRARGRRPQSTEALDDELAESEGMVSVDHPENAAVNSRIRDALEVFLAELPLDEKRLVQEGLFQGRTHDEMAAATGLSARQCKYLKKKILSRAAEHPALLRALSELRGGEHP